LFDQMVQFALPTLLGGTFLLVVVVSGARLTLPRTLLAGVCLMLLPFCQATGLVLAPLPLLWLVYCGLIKWKSNGTTAMRDGLFTLAVACVGFVPLILYLLGIDPVEFNLNTTLAHSFFEVSKGTF
jgi:hypothetical protein